MKYSSLCYLYHTEIESKSERTLPKKKKAQDHTEYNMKMPSDTVIDKNMDKVLMMLASLSQNESETNHIPLNVADFEPPQNDSNSGRESQIFGTFFSFVF